MKFIIDGTEIKTVVTGAKLENSLEMPSRYVVFSYVYNNEDEKFKNYKAKTGSQIVIKNDDNKNIFRGLVTKIDFSRNNGLVTIHGQDYISLLLSIKQMAKENRTAANKY